MITPTNETRTTMIRKLLPSLLLAVLLLVGLLFASPALADTRAYVGATIHPVSAPAIEDGVLLVEDGRIVALGADVEPPPEAEVIDLEGLHLYPGFIHPGSALGLVEVASVAGTVDVAEMGENNADLRAEVAFHADSALLPETMSNGVLTAHVVMRGGTFMGTSAVMRLDGWNWRDMTLHAPAALHLDFPAVSGDGDDDGEGEGEGEEGGSSKVMDEIEDLLVRARHYAKARDAGTVDRNPKLEPFLPVFAGELPLYVHADETAQIEKALDWADEQGFEKIVLVSGTDVRRVAQRLAEEDVPVILTGTLALPEHRWEGYDAPFVAPKELHEAGVRFAIGDGGSAFGAAFARNLAFQAAQAVAFGLPHDEAIRSITLAPAEILGVADHVGSLEPGKEATFFAVAGDPLEIRNPVERVWVQGREVDLEDRHHYRLYRKYAERPTPERLEGE